MFRMKKPNQFLNRVAVLTILNCVAVVLSTRDPTQSLGMSGSLSDSSVDSDLSKAWPEVKDGFNSNANVIDVPSRDSSDQNVMRFATVPKVVAAGNPSGAKKNKSDISQVARSNGNTTSVVVKPTTGYRWTKIGYKGAAPARREGHTSVAVEDYIITFGGCYLDKKCFNDLFVFNTRTNGWVVPKVSGMPPLEREGHTSTMVGPLMYVYGGSSEVGYLDDVYALNVNPGLPGSGEELPMAWGHIDVSGPQPVGREGHSAVQLGARILYFGGYTEKGFSNEVVVLDTAMKAWETPAIAGVKPSGREGHTAILYNNRMFIFGGFTNGGCLNDLYILDIKTMSWELGITSGTTPSMRQDHSAILRGNEMLFVGGCNFGKGKCFCDLNILNLRNLAWREEKTKGVTDDLVVSPREDHTMTMVRGKAFLFGGCYLAQRCYNDMYTLEPSTGHLRCGGNGCSGHGVCRAYANREKSMADKETYACVCQPGYTGEDCSEITSCPNDCSGHG
eukprot:g3610.t1